MNESTGSSLLLNIVVLMTGLMIVVFAASFAYTKAYRAKSIIVDIIEEHSGDVIYYDVHLKDSVRDEIAKQLSNMGYGQVQPKKCVNKKNRSSTDTYKNNGYCIYRITESDDYGNTSYYYEVETYMHFDIPLINFSIPVYGQTISFRQKMVNTVSED